MDVGYSIFYIVYDVVTVVIKTGGISYRCRKDNLAVEKISELVPFFFSFPFFSLSLSKKENNTIELHASEYFLLAGIPYNAFAH